jgi:putative DNA primase/helicase
MALSTEQPFADIFTELEELEKRQQWKPSDIVRHILSRRYPNGELFEIRATVPNGNGNRDVIYAALYNDHEAAINDVRWLTQKTSASAIYTNLQRIKSTAEYQNAVTNKIAQASGAAEASDIAQYVRLLIDVDTKRPDEFRKSSSTDLEKADALEVITNIKTYMESLGLSGDLYDSGNGYHNVYGLDLPATEDSKLLLEAVLAGLHEKFSTDRAEVDKTVYDLPRVCKLIGSYARKGENTPERPHRLSKIVSEATELKPIPADVLLQIAGFSTAPKAPVQQQAADAELEKSLNWLRGFVEWADLSIQNEKRHEGGSILVLESDCPFGHASGHHAGECHVGVNREAKFAFACKHNSCTGRGWKEFRAEIEKHKDSKYMYGLLRSAEPQACAQSADAGELRTEGSQLKTVRADQIKTKKIKWLWDHRIPFGKLSVFAGNPDQGKSLVTMYMVSQLTTGRPLYGSANALPACEVLILAGEDEADDTIIPRLQAGGADLSKIHIVESVAVTDGKGQTVAEREAQLDIDLQAIEETLKRNPNIRLVIVDPLSNYLGDTNMNREQEVRRRVLIPLKTLAARCNVAVLAVMHLNKSSDASAIHRIGGAVAFAGVARAVWLFLEDPTDKDKHLMLRVKGNIAKRIGGLRYRILAKTVLVEGTPEYQPYIEWEGETDQVASDVLIGGKPVGRPSEKVASAEEWLSSFLSKGSETAADVKKHGSKQGHTWRTIERAKTSLGIVVEKAGSVWEWSLPNQDRHNSEIVDLEAPIAK